MSTLIVRKVAELRAMTRSWRQQGETIGVVPTMGALHAGHLSLVEAAKAQCDRVIVTLFVNPRQFNSPEDYATYPRTEEADATLLAPYAVDALFVPDGIEVYPEGHATTVSVARVSEPLEGAHRPGHFDGVATVVTLLFNMTTPDSAFFGEKDWQQLQVIRRLVADLHLPIQIVACPTLRSGNGLALSSRNQRLTPEAREAASALFATLQRAAGRIAAGEPFAPALDAARRELQDMGFGPVEYLELRDGASLGAACPGQPARLLVAAWLDGVRLIDNVAVDLRS